MDWSGVENDINRDGASMDGSTAGEGDGDGAEGESEGRNTRHGEDEVTQGDGNDGEQRSETNNDGHAGGGDGGSTAGVMPDMAGKDPVDNYPCFISDSILDGVLEETNRYGEQYVQSHQAPDQGHMTS